MIPKTSVRAITHRVTVIARRIGLWLPVAAVLIVLCGAWFVSIERRSPRVEESAADFAKRASTMRERAIGEVQPQVFVPTRRDNPIKEQSRLDEQIRIALEAEQEGDYQRAVKLYQSAAEKNDPFAQTQLAMIYLDGRGVPRDYAKAVQLLEKAAAQGDPNAQTNLKGEVGRVSTFDISHRAFFNPRSNPVEFRALNIFWKRESCSRRRTWFSETDL